MTVAQLIAFERRVAKAFENKQVKGPIHLSGGNEDALLYTFDNVGSNEWVFSTYRSHYHALLKGIPPDWLYAEILAGRSMCISSVEHKFHSSAIVGGCLSQAVGVAFALKRQGKHLKEMVHCFVGDMAESTGAYHEAHRYAAGHNLPIRFIVEDNGLSCDSPTRDVWGHADSWKECSYQYKRTYPHSGIGHNVF